MPESPSLWSPLQRLDWLIVTIVVVLVLVLAWPHTPPGICLGDSGGLQLASATLGITHPPGYVGYATIGYLGSIFPGLSPARSVTLLCLASGLAALGMCVLLQIRLGVNRWIAGAIALGLTAHPRVWNNLITPEVYLPTLCCTVFGFYRLIAFSRTGKIRNLVLGSLSVGVALANRPPVLFCVPALLMAWVVTCRHLSATRRRSFGWLAIAVGSAMLPLVYSFGYLWVRDTPNTPYNYIEQYNEEFGVLPRADAGARAKLQRIVWLSSGAQFRSLMGNDWPGVRSRVTRWLPNELCRNRLIVQLRSQCLLVMGAYAFWFNHLATASLFVVVAVGMVCAFRRNPMAGWLLLGLLSESVLFVCFYRANGDAADLLPLLFAVAVLLGLATSSRFSSDVSRWRPIVAISLFGMLSLYTALDGPHRSASQLTVDAEPFLRQVDMSTLPRNSTILCGWSRATALWYARLLIADRPDLRIINARRNAWPRFVGKPPWGPVFAVARHRQSDAGWKDSDWVPYRNLWQLSPERSGKLVPN